MRVLRLLDAWPEGAPAAWTIGNFDGVHLGHRHIVERLRLQSKAANVPAWALTFDPHPAAVLRPERPLALLTSIDRRLQLLEDAGLDGVVVTPFDTGLSALKPDAFAAMLLGARLGARAVVVGADFRFGAGRAGTVADLSALGALHGFSVESVEPVLVDGAVVSSTRIRSALEAGDVTLVTRLLGRPHDVGGIVVAGQRRGRTIGFPTANLSDLDAVLPSDGVYACRVALPGGSHHDAVASSGVRPTLAAGRSLEVHLLDFTGDLYGARIRVAFVARLRAEQRFSGLEELRAQIALDARRAREQLAECLAEGSSGANR